MTATRLVSVEGLAAAARRYREAVSLWQNEHVNGAYLDDRVKEAADAFDTIYFAALPAAPAEAGLREAATKAADWLDISQKMYHLLVQKWPRESEDSCEAGMCWSMREHRDALRAALAAQEGAE